MTNLRMTPSLHRLTIDHLGYDPCRDSDVWAFCVPLDAPAGISVARNRLAEILQKSAPTIIGGFGGGVLVLGGFTSEGYEKWGVTLTDAKVPGISAVSDEPSALRLAILTLDPEFN